MPPAQNSWPLSQPPHSGSLLDPSMQTQHTSMDDSDPVIFTRQLWQRARPGAVLGEQTVLNKSQTANTQASHNNASESRRSSLTVSLRSRGRSPSPDSPSKTPLTPEESPSFKATRKRSAAVLDLEEGKIDSSETSPVHTRSSSGDSVHVCICQPDRKIPRPRNAFILYRQHHQANVVARNPGLANPDISKILGEQWQNENPEVKSKWKALAEEEKRRHHRQYPTYRYQPKRNGRNSTDGPASAAGKANCRKCMGRLPYSVQNSGIQTPATAGTPLSRTLPILRDLSLESPAARQMRGFSSASNMSPIYHAIDERDGKNPSSPESKRRRFNDDQQRVMPPRYSIVDPGAVVGSGMPFSYAPPPPLPAYAVTGPRRESLPGIRGVASPPGSMAPPPRPGMGYHAHRLSQGHMPPARSLTLPPLQVMTAPPTSSSGLAQSAEEQIMSISFRYKIKVLCQVAPPVPKNEDEPRGPLIAVEGDNRAAVADLAKWLSERLKGEELDITIIDGPKVELPSTQEKEDAMASYHRLAAEWLGRNKSIVEALRMKTWEDNGENTDTSMVDAEATASPAGHDDSKSPTNEAEVDRVATSTSASDSTEEANEQSSQNDPEIQNSTNVDKRVTRSSTLCNPNQVRAKPVFIVPNYSLATSNHFAQLIPLSASDPYAPSDHWQWTATLWRGIVGPDLTIYLRDVSATGGVGGVEMERVEGREDIGLVVVRRVINGEIVEVEGSLKRRVGFEVSEWVRAF